MAGSKYAYVKSFELPDYLLPNTFIVARLDGHAFHRFSDVHGFIKPNDERALKLMDHAARNVIQEFRDIVLGFGESDEYSFLLRKSSSYVMLWDKYFPSTPLRYAPSFDGRLVMYPGEKEVRDYFAWRQTDTHVNNLYNTIFWALVQQGGQITTQAHETLRGTVSSVKNEMLFNQFGVNYNELPPRFRKGSVLVRTEVVSPTTIEGPACHPETSDVEVASSTGTSTASTSHQQASAISRHPQKNKITYEISVLHCDIIKNDFWLEHPDILT